MSTGETQKRGRPIDVAKRAAILEAAAHAFLELGFAAASIEQIAADAGVSKVTVYNQFGDKRTLFAGAVEHECSRMRTYFSIGGMESGSLRERLTAIGHAMVEFLSRPEMIQFERRIAAETEQEPELGMAFLAAGPHHMKAALTAFLCEMAEVGDVEVDNHEQAAEQFSSMCKGMGDLERRFGHPADPEKDRVRINGAVEVFCRAYSVRSRA